MWPILLIAGTEPAVANRPLTAEAVVGRFADDFCRPEANQLNAAKGWDMRGWKIVDRATKRDITYSVDGPIPKHDRYEHRYAARVAGGEAMLMADTADYASRDQYDHSTASLTIAPDTLLDEQTIERALQTDLLPTGKPIESPGVATISGGGEPTRTTKPFARWLQHYRAADTVGNVVAITARRIWGDIGNQQSWYIQCATGMTVVDTPPSR